MKKLLFFYICSMLVLLMATSANALSIDLRTNTNDTTLTIDETVTSFNLNLVWSSTPVAALGFETHFSIPSPFDLTTYSINSSAWSNLADAEITDFSTSLRLLAIFFSPGTNITDPLVASLNFSVDPNALAGDYTFSQVASQPNYLLNLDNALIPLDSSSFTVSVEKNTPVPEPTTMLLLGAGLVGLAGFGRKKFKK